jgi:hypothetical protein
VGYTDERMNRTRNIYEHIDNSWRSEQKNVAICCLHNIYPALRGETSQFGLCFCGRLHKVLQYLKMLDRQRTYCVAVITKVMNELAKLRCEPMAMREDTRATLEFGACRSIEDKHNAERELK